MAPSTKKDLYDDDDDAYPITWQIEDEDQHPTLPLVNEYSDIHPQITSDEKEMLVTYHLSEYSLENILVKTSEDHIIVEGKYRDEERDEIVRREFCSRIILPPDCAPKKVHCDMSKNSVLTVVAPKGTKFANNQMFFKKPGLKKNTAIAADQGNSTNKKE